MVANYYYFYKLLYLDIPVMADQQKLTFIISSVQTQGAFLEDLLRAMANRDGWWESDDDDDDDKYKNYLNISIIFYAK